MTALERLLADPPKGWTSRPQWCHLRTTIAWLSWGEEEFARQHEAQVELIRWTGPVELYGRAQVLPVGSGGMRRLAERHRAVADLLDALAAAIDADR